MFEGTVNNKRIAKNTLLLYVRTLFIMLVTLYTSRVVLNTLGVSDYGIYNVVGGVVAMFGFINASMSSATQRYITFALGKGDIADLRKIFSTALQIHVLIAALIVVLGETVGLWFMYTQMQIPADRMNAAFWVLQCSIVSSVVMIISVPYNADIIAHERMSAFAYISIIEAVLRLAIVYLLLAFSYDKLILYAFLTLAVQLLIRFCYSSYCNKHFPESKYRHVWDKFLFKEMTGFAGWGMFSSLSGILSGQGLNMLLNVFFGPVVNAARAVAVQVQDAILQFIGNFQMAINPQITKTYANGEMEDMHKLMFRSARFTFYLLFVVSLPVLFETNFILTVWLKTVPENTVIFLRIMICVSLLYPLSNPLIIANQATGQVRNFQFVSGLILLFILPVSYICLSFGLPAYSVFVVHFIMEFTTLFYRLRLLRSSINIRFIDYFKNVFFRVVLVVAISIIIPIAIYNYMGNTIIRFFLICIICILSVGLSAYTVGLSHNERLFIKSKAIYIFNKIKSR